MKAAYIEQFGGPEVIKYGGLPDPSPGPGQVVVDVFAASVNGADWKVRANHYGKAALFPLILGRDFSGVAGAVGAGVTDLGVGDEVFGVLELGREGAYAEKIATNASIVAKKPTRKTGSHHGCSIVAIPSAMPTSVRRSSHFIA